MTGGSFQRMVRFGQLEMKLQFQREGIRWVLAGGVMQVIGFVIPSVYRYRIVGKAKKRR